MGKIEEALKTEITRLARKELRATVEPLAKEVRQLKRTVARLSKTLAGLDKAAALKARRQPAGAVMPGAGADEVKASRITSGVIKNLRKKLGVSQESMAVLLGVSPGAVAVWEQGRARPRGGNKAALVALRKLGRRDVKRLLAAKGIQAGRRRSGTK